MVDILSILASDIDERCKQYLNGQDKHLKIHAKPPQLSFTEILGPRHWYLSGEDEYTIVLCIIVLVQQMPKI